MSDDTTEAGKLITNELSGYPIYNALEQKEISVIVSTQVGVYTTAIIMKMCILHVLPDMSRVSRACLPYDLL